MIRGLREATAPRREADPHAYPGRPVEYAERVLGVHTLTAEQQQMLRLLHVPPFRVLVPSAHDVGKTFAAAVAASYWFDSYDPGLVLTTAPTEKDVIDLLWTEIRLLRRRAGLPSPFIGPKAPELYDHEDHYAKGYVSRLGQGFQGRHRPRMLFIKDEANDVDALHFTTTRTMFDPELGHAELCIFNPTSTTSQVYQEDLACDDPSRPPPWHRIRLSALNHPNIKADLEGRRRPVPGAVTKAMVDEWVREWCEPVRPGDHEATDLEWPPGSSRWYRPGPIFQARAMGQWPDTGSGVWSPALWDACLREPPPFPFPGTPEIGCDCATGKGDDYHAIHARWGPASVHHETSNTMEPARIFERLKDVAARMAALANQYRDRGARPVVATDILIKLDDDGTGGAIGSFLREAGYSVCCIGAATNAQDQGRYARKRDELWFQTAGKAKAGLVSLSQLDAATRARLRQQLLAPAWDLDPAGRRRVEPKEVTKEKIGRSPDDADAANLAFHDGITFGRPILIDNPVPGRHPGDGRQSHAERRGLFRRR
ncbi:MAG TPA: hypothetical protein VFW33_16860 [Gemmataceae bacterium]|nr:hypothetical protein [Gemmataceae bacterium]